MRSDTKEKALNAMKRLDGLTKKLRAMAEKDAPCVQILEITLAMQGHVLKHHLHACAEKKLTSNSGPEKEAFIAELLKVIDLSKR